MSYNVIVTSKFTRQIKQLAKKYKRIKEDFTGCVEQLTANPFAGTELGRGFYKLRLKSSDKSRGKSGGFRVIYYVITGDEELYLLTIYSKSEIESIRMDQIQKIVDDLNL